MFNLGEIIKRKRQSADVDAFGKIGGFAQLLSGQAIIQKLIDQDRKHLSLKYQFPATLRKAKRHVRAIKYGYHPITHKKRTLCPCCQLQINTQQYSVLKDHTTVLFDLDDFRLNSCVAFFFTFIKYLVVLLFLRLIILDIFNIVTNLVDGNYCVGKCSKQFWSLSSIIHKYNRKDLIGITNILTFVVSIVYIICFIGYRKFQYSMYDKIDQLNQTQDDFTIFVQNIPILNFPEQADSSGNFQFDYDKDLCNIMSIQLQKWIKSMDRTMQAQGSIQKDYIDLLYERGEEYQTIPDDLIKSVTLCYDLSRIEKISKLRDNLIKKHEQNCKKGVEGEIQGMHSSFDTIPEQIQFLNECEVTLSKSLALQKSLVFKATHFVGSAFISFKYQHYRDHLLQMYHDNSKAFKMKDRYLRLSKASYPTDVLWKNIKINDSNRLKRVFASFGILFAVILIAFCALLASDTYKNFLLKNLKKSEEFKKTQQSGSINWGSMSITFVTTLVTLAINYLLQILAYSLTKWQKHQSMARSKSSLVSKLLVTQFVNTAMIYLVLSHIKNEDNSGLLSEQGLIHQISNYMILSGCLQVINNALYYAQILRWIKYVFNYCGKDDEDDIQKFQVTLNREVEHCEFDLAQRYSYYLLQLYLVAFYAYAVPIIVPAVIVIFFFQYIVDKYNLFKRSSLFYELQYSLSRYILKMAEGSLVLFALGSLMFSARIQKKVDTFLIVNLILAVCFILLSIFIPEKQYKRIFRANQKCQKFEYDECVRAGKFKQTYWLNNPATKLLDESFVTNRKYVKNQAVYDITLKDKTSHQDLQQQEQQKLNSALRMLPI